MRLIIPLFLIAAFFIGMTDAEAQCSMCKAVLESNMQSGEEAVGKGINSGIVYIMFVPYILLGAIGYFMYKHYVKTNKV